jgi:hypothetical protein
VIQFELSDEEREVLAEILQTVHSDLRMEIAGTDSKDFRDTLKARKEVVAKVLAALGASSE